VSFAELLVVGFAISLDNLAASLALGARLERRLRLRASLIFAGFGGLAPALGIIVGRHLASPVRAWAEWIGVAALAALGLWAIVSSRSQSYAGPPRRAGLAPFLLLGASLSLDNLVVGFGVGLHGANALSLAGVTAAMVFFASFAGMHLGRRGYRRWGAAARAAAGVLILAIAAALAAGVL
jgi:manganese efflux pump family protein